MRSARRRTKEASQVLTKFVGAAAWVVRNALHGALKCYDLGLLIHCWSTSEIGIVYFQATTIYLVKPRLAEFGRLVFGLVEVLLVS